jgi:hypothetical protein
MYNAQILGPAGIVFDDTVSAGIYFQYPHLDYTDLSHAAEETYFTLAGQATWRLEGHASDHPIGRYIFRKPNALHATLTGETPLLAQWRWYGDIG